MPDAHFIADLLQDKLYSILLVQGKTPEGEEAYAYIAIRADVVAMFARAQAEGQDICLSDYGKILAEGTGIPDEATRRYMEELYNFNHLGGFALKGEGL